MGAQVVGRAFARALRQEFAGQFKEMLYYVHLSIINGILILVAVIIHQFGKWCLFLSISA